MAIQRLAQKRLIALGVGRHVYYRPHLFRRPCFGLAPSGRICERADLGLKLQAAAPHRFAVLEKERVWRVIIRHGAFWRRGGFCREVFDLERELQDCFAAFAVGVVFQVERAAVDLGDLAADDQSDSGSVLFGREEGDKQVIGFGEARSLILDP